MPAFCAASAAATATRGAQSCSSLRIHERRRLDIQSSDEDLNFLLIFTQSCDTFVGFITFLFKLLFVEPPQNYSCCVAGKHRMALRYLCLLTFTLREGGGV